VAGDAPPACAKSIAIVPLLMASYENRTEWHRVFAWRNLSKFAKTLQKGQLITLEGILRYREVEDEVNGTTFKHRIAEVHAISIKRLSKIDE
jgi:single-strand DNA-binding protein